MKLLRKILESDAGHQAVQHPGLQRRHRLGRAEGLAAEHRRPDATKHSRGWMASSSKAPPTSAPPWTKLAKPGFETTDGSAVDVFLLSDGQITWGEPDVGTLVARFEARCPLPTHFHCYRTGLGADNLELFEALTRQRRRHLQLLHRGRPGRRCRRPSPAVPDSGQRPFRRRPRRERRPRRRPQGRRLSGRRADRRGEAGLARPARRCCVEGTFQGQKVVEEYPLEVAGAGELAGRGWAEIAVASLLALNDPTLDNLVTAYCQQFGIASRVASFLVLENVNDYKRLNLEEERGKTVGRRPGQLPRRCLEEHGPGRVGPRIPSRASSTRSSRGSTCSPAPTARTSRSC